MSQELTIQSLGDTVKDRVKSAIFASIPDAAVEALLAKEFENLTKKREHYQNEGRSELQSLIYMEIKRQASERVSKSVAVYLDQNFNSNDKNLVDAAIKELAPLFMAGMAESFAAAATQQLRQQLYNKGISF